MDRIPMNRGPFSGVSRLAAFLLLSLSVLGVAAAEDADPPGRVARLSYTQGSVSLQPAGVEDWTTVKINRPLTTGDKLWTDANSRAELDMGSAAIRLGSATGFSFLNLDDRTAQMRVTAGTVIVHVRSLGNDQSYEIDTPNLAVSLERPGDYRVEVNDAGDTTVVKVSDGEARASGGGEDLPIHAQQAVTFTGTEEVASDVETLTAPDDLDSWSLERDRRTQRARSAQYVSTDVAGYEDLDDYGRWQYTPNYGYIWAPTVVVPGWSPYRFGHWVWISPWGWTWIDDAPWGFAPFHYGRWVYFASSWCWVPGPHIVRPIYAPALVAWVGGPRFGVSVSAGRIGGGVGWFPLGPREVYVPGYHVSRTYVRNVNVTNTTIVNNTYITNVYEKRVNNIQYANRGAPGAVTAVSQSVFTSGQPVGGHTMHVPETALRQGSATTIVPAIAPGRQSVLGPGARADVHRPPQDFLNRPVVARMMPPSAPVPFSRQEEAIRANGGRPLAQVEMARLQPSAPIAPVRLVAPAQDERHQPGFGRAIGTGPAGPNSGRNPGELNPVGANRPGASVQQPGARPEAPAALQGGGLRGMQERERALPEDRALREDRPPAAQNNRAEQIHPQINNNVVRSPPIENRSPSPVNHIETHPMPEPRAVPERHAMPEPPRPAPPPAAPPPAPQQRVAPPPRAPAPARQEMPRARPEPNLKNNRQ